ncbi:GntR family transcriptional regulator, partial [Enterococcus lactis]
MAKYQDIAEEIKQKILHEEYEVNTTIPSEFKLQEIYDVSRHTIRQAIAVLVNEGYLR